MKKAIELIERMEDRIMKHQAKYGFASTFDFINEDLSELKEIVKSSVTQKPVAVGLFNLNHEAIIYPNQKGFAKIKALLANRYLLSSKEADAWASKRKTEDGGYKEQLWVIISELHDMFYNGQDYMTTMSIKFLNQA